MAEVVLFHHALGLTTGVTGFVGVYIGYFEMSRGRVCVAELPSADVAIAAQRTLGSATVAATSGPSVVASAGVAGAR